MIMNIKNSIFTFIFSLVMSQQLFPAIWNHNQFFCLTQRSLDTMHLLFSSGVAQPVLLNLLERTKRTISELGAKCVEFSTTQDNRFEPLKFLIEETTAWCLISKAQMLEKKLTLLAAKKNPAIDQAQLQRLTDDYCEAFKEAFDHLSEEEVIATKKECALMVFNELIALTEKSLVIIVD